MACFQFDDSLHFWRVSQGHDIVTVMTTTDTINIVKTLKPRIGEKAAVELVRYIESAHTEHLATKTDIHAVGADMQELPGELKVEMQDLRADMQQIKADLNGQILALENRLVWKMLGGMGLLLALFSGLIRFMVH